MRNLGRGGRVCQETPEPKSSKIGMKRHISGDATAPRVTLAVGHAQSTSSRRLLSGTLGTSDPPQATRTLSTSATDPHIRGHGTDLVRAVCAFSSNLRSGRRRAEIGKLRRGRKAAKKNSPIEPHRPHQSRRRRKRAGCLAVTASPTQTDSRLLLVGVRVGLLCRAPVEVE